MADVFDPKHFHTMTGGDAALQSEVVALFRTQSARSLALLAPGASAQAWRDAAHTLKGSARGLGLWALAEACQQAETQPGQAEALAQVQAALQAGLAALDARAA